MKITISNYHLDEGKEAQLITQGVICFHYNTSLTISHINKDFSPISTPPYVVSSRAPSVQHSRAFRAAPLFANSTIPFPVGQPWSSVTTIARSTGPNWEKAWWKKTPQQKSGETRCTFLVNGWEVAGEVHLLQQLVGDCREQVAHGERSAVDRKADSDRSVVHHRPVQLSFCNFCKRPSFLGEGQTNKDRGMENLKWNWTHLHQLSPAKQKHLWQEWMNETWRRLHQKAASSGLCSHFIRIRFWTNYSRR